MIFYETLKKNKNNISYAYEVNKNKKSRTHTIKCTYVRLYIYLSFINIQ